MKDAEQLKDRVLELGGLPNLQRLNAFQVGEVPKEQLELALELEQRAVTTLLSAIRVSEEEGDPATSTFLSELLLSEEGQVDCSSRNWVSSSSSASNSTSPSRCAHEPRSRTDEPAAAESTPAELPVLLVAIHAVRDYDKWPNVVHESRESLVAQGVTGYTIYQAVDDSHEVLVAMEIATRRGAGLLLADPDELRSFLDEANVNIYPAVFVGRESERIDFAYLLAFVRLTYRDPAEIGGRSLRSSRTPWPHAAARGRRCGCDAEADVAHQHGADPCCLRHGDRRQEGVGRRWIWG